MTHRLRLVLLLLAVTLTLAIPAAPYASAADGLTCTDPPTPCSTFNTSRCTYSYDATIDCCIPHQHLCFGVCC